MLAPPHRILYPLEASHPEQFRNCQSVFFTCPCLFQKKEEATSRSNQDSRVFSHEAATNDGTARSYECDQSLRHANSTAQSWSDLSSRREKVYGSWIWKFVTDQISGVQPDLELVCLCYPKIGGHGDRLGKNCVLASQCSLRIHAVSYHEEFTISSQPIERGRARKPEDIKFICWPQEHYHPDWHLLSRIRNSWDCRLDQRHKDQPGYWANKPPCWCWLSNGRLDRSNWGWGWFRSHIRYPGEAFLGRERLP